MLQLQQLLGGATEKEENGKDPKHRNDQNRCGAAGVPPGVVAGIADIFFKLPIIKHNYAWSGSVSAGTFCCQAVQTPVLAGSYSPHKAHMLSASCMRRPAPRIISQRALTHTSGLPVRLHHIALLVQMAATTLGTDLPLQAVQATVLQ